MYIHTQVKYTIAQLLFRVGHRDICLKDCVLDSLFLMNEKIMCFNIFSHSPKNFKVIAIHLVDLVSVSSLWP